MIAGTHLCLDLTSCRCVLIETVDQCPLSWYYRFDRFGRKNEKACACGKCDNWNTIKVCAWCHYTKMGTTDPWTRCRCLRRGRANAYLEILASGNGQKSG